jgi:hypothetical protein
MDELIGETEALSTWGVLRYAVVQGALPGSAAHNREYYPAGLFFKSAEGNGLVKGGYGITYYLPAMGFITDPFGGPATFYGEGLVEPYPTQFVGETVTISGPDSFIITASAFVAPGFQSVTTSGFNPITSIGLLTPVT